MRERRSVAIDHIDKIELDEETMKKAKELE